MSSHVYVVFCRIDGIKDHGMSNDQVAGMVRTLKNVVQDVIKPFSKKPGATDQVTIFGRFVLVKEQVSTAIEIARSILNKSADANVLLQAGIAGGVVEHTTDLLSDNRTGVAINLAARLASVPEMAGQIVLLDKVVEDAARASKRYRDFDLRSKPAKVKKNELLCCSLPYPAVTCSEFIPRDGESGPSERRPIVVYDIADFSAHGTDDLVSLVENLNWVSKKALEPFQSDRSKSQDLPYAPAGDGGAVVFTNPAAAFGFAKSLLNHAREKHIELRVGVTTDQIVRIDKLPVGLGIVRADHLCGLPQPGQICCDLEFYSELRPGHKADWLVRECLMDERAIVIGRERDPDADDLLVRTIGWFQALHQWHEDEFYSRFEDDRLATTKHSRVVGPAGDRPA